MLPMPYTRPDRRRGRRFHADVVTGAREFGALRGPWTALLRESRSDCVFLTWEWLHAWWSHLRGDQALHLLLVRNGDELIGAAPLARSHGALPWMSRLTFLG